MTDVEQFELTVARVARAAIRALRDPELDKPTDETDTKLVESVRWRIAHPAAEPTTQEGYLFASIVLTLSADLEALKAKAP